MFKPDGTLVNSPSLTEEEVTGALIRSLKTGERNVCFLNAAGEHSVDESSGRGYSYLKQILERDNYKVRTETLKPAAAADQKLAVGQTPAAAAPPQSASVCGRYGTVRVRAGAALASIGATSAKAVRRVAGKTFATKDTKGTKANECVSWCPLCPLW